MEDNDITEEPFKADDFGRIKLTKEMRDAAILVQQHIKGTTGCAT